MAEATSPDLEVQFNRKHDEEGQGDQDLGFIEMRCLDATPVHARGPVRPRVINLEPDRSPPILPRFGAPRDPMEYASMVIKPDTYDGKGDWDEYISHFRDCAELGGWSERSKLLLLAASLRGQARTFYMSINEEERQSYGMLVCKLNQRFGSSRNQTRWLSKFEMRRRLPGESIADLGDDLRQMAQRAYSNLDTQAQEALALNQLYKVISVEMKCRCIDKDCLTVAEAVDVIERYESFVGDPSGNNRKQNLRAIDKDNVGAPREEGNPNTRDQTAKHPDPRINDLLDRINQLENSMDQKNKYRRNGGNRNCYICHSTDHFMRNCPHRDSQSRYQTSYKSFRGTGNRQQGNEKPPTSTA